MGRHGTWDEHLRSVLEVMDNLWKIMLVLRWHILGACRALLPLVGLRRRERPGEAETWDPAMVQHTLEGKVPEATAIGSCCNVCI